MDLEATPGGVFELTPENGIVTHANHMVAGAKYCTNHGSKFRDAVLRRRLMERRGDLDLETLRSCLTDHEMKPRLAHGVPGIRLPGGRVQPCAPRGHRRG